MTVARINLGLIINYFVILATPLSIHIEPSAQITFELFCSIYMQNMYCQRIYSRIQTLGGGRGEAMPLFKRPTKNFRGLIPILAFFHRI